MVEAVYAAVSGSRRRDEKVNPHLHNVPAADRRRARPAGAARSGSWFVVALTRDLWRALPRRANRVLAAAALAAVVAMLAAGLFEYNFGDSEFLMLFLILVTLPFAAHRSAIRRRRMTLPPLDAARARDLLARLRRPSRARRRRRDARSLHRRPRDADLAGSAGAGRALRVGARAPRRRRQRGAQHRGARRRSVSLVGIVGADAAADRLRQQLESARHRRRRPGRGPAAARPPKRCGSSPSAISRWRGSTTRSDADAAGDVEQRARRRRRAARRRTPKSLLVSDYLKGTVTTRRSCSRWSR